MSEVNYKDYLVKTEEELEEDDREYSDEEIALIEFLTL